MTSFSPNPEPRPRASSGPAPGSEPGFEPGPGFGPVPGSEPGPGRADDAPSRYPAGPLAGPPDGGWQTGPEEDWHTGSQPAIPPAAWPDQALGSLPSQPAPLGQPPHLGQPAHLPQPAAQARPEALARPGPARPGPAQPGDHAADAIGGPVRDGDEAWAMLGYLGVPFVSILAPLTVYLVRARSSGYVRQHATQALNLSITLVLYNICALILAGMLSLDGIGVALLIAGPVALALWLVTLAYLVRAAVKASLGEFYRLPSWICATIAR